jgi:S-adenosylmethionine uptake transporter
MMALSKILKNYSPLQVNFIRSLLVFFALTPPLLLFKGSGSLKTKQPFLQILRMVTSSLSMICFFYGYRMLPITKASAINFSYALIMPLFAILFLKEKISLQRWIFLGIGYIGIVVIVDPVFETFELGEGLALLGVILLAGSSILVKKLTKTDESLVVVFYSSVATSFFLGVYFLIASLFTVKDTLPQWTPIHWKDGFVLGSIGALSLLGQFSYVQAYRKGRLNFLAGFDYLKFLFASLIGFWFFNEKVETPTFYGAFIILICSYMIAREELRKKYNYENY